MAGVNKCILLGIVRDSTLPLMSWLGEWVNSVISILVLLLLILPNPPDSIFKGV
jgi:hypothetical protein